MKLLLFLCMVCAVVCDYELRVRVHSYLNEDSRCATCTPSLVNPMYGCCDNQTNTGVCSGDELCDIFFRYCLRSLGATGIRCPLNVTAVDTFLFLSNTDILLDIGDTVLGSENPFLYSGPVWMGFQFYLMAKDSGIPDGVGAKDIDSFAIDLNIEGGQRLKPQVFQGRFRIAEIELSFEVICTDNYSFPNCTSCDPGTSNMCTQRGTATTLPSPDPPGPNDVTTDVRSDGTTAAIAGGVVGGLVGVVLIAVIVIVIVIIVKNKQESSENDSSGETANDDIIICQNNAVYGVNTQTNTLTTTGLLPSSLQEHEYDYPLHDISEPLPSVYESVDDNNEELMVNVNVSYATVPERWTD